MGARGHDGIRNDDALGLLDDLLDGDAGGPEVEEALRPGAEGASDLARRPG